MHWKVVCVGFLLATAAALLAPAKPALAQPVPAESGRLELSAAEQAFVAARPEVVAAMVGSPIPPLQSWPEAGRVDGIIADYFALIEQRTGLRIRPRVAATLAQRNADFVARRADLLPLVLSGDPVGSRARLTAPFFRAAPVWVTRNETADFSPTGDLGGLRVTVTPGGAFEQYIRHRFPAARVVEASSPLDELKAVSEGRADARIGQLPMTVHTIEANLLANLTVRAHAEGAPASYAMGVHPNDGVLLGLIGRALASISNREHDEIAARWVPARQVAGLDARGLLLNDAERSWLRSHARIGVAYDRDFGPFTFEHDRAMQGLGADLLRLVAGRLGLEIVQARAGTWAQAYEAAVAGEVDLLVAAARNDDRRGRFHFVGPWSSSPTAIVGQSGMRGPVELGDLGGQVLAVQDRHFLLPHLRRQFPGVRLLVLPTLAEAFRAVRDGRAGAAIGNQNVASQLIATEHPGALALVGQVRDGDSELFFAVPRDRPELAHVLAKGLESLSPAERGRLQQQWLSVRYAPGWSSLQVLSFVLPVALAAILVIAVVRRGNRRLQAEVRQRRDAEARLAASLEREAEVSRSKSGFIASLSHEVRNPMAAIVSAAGLLRRHVADDTGARLLEGIQRAGDGLLGLLSRTLDFSKAESGMLTTQREWVEPQAWCRGVVSAFDAIAQRKGLALAVTLTGADGVQAEFDPVRLGQVLGNLVSNALKFTAEGRVEVTLRPEPAAGRLMLTVADTGQGIAADELPRLFQPYVQLSSGRQRHAEGTGLGLALCRQIVEHMGGRIVAESAAGQGSRFSVELPVAFRSAPPPAVAEPVPPANVEGSPVLLVDDDPTGLLVLSEQFRVLGFQVLAHDNAELALEQWLRSPTAIVVTDCHMPGMDGPELTRQLRQWGGHGKPRPWIVVYTGSDDADAHATCLACGADDVWVKPLQPQEIRRRLPGNGPAGVP